MSLARYLSPWSYKREQAERQLAELRQRDGDACRRCRRPLRFDLPDGHDLGPKIEGASDADADRYLTHRRCHSAGADHTAEVAERRKRKNEAELLAKQPKRRKRAA